MSQPRYLVVPMLVDGLRVTTDTHVLGPPRFQELPHVGRDGNDQPVDRNPGRPFLAETTHPPAFTPPEFTLGAGVHLHWVLPRAFRTARAGGEALEFPPAPDQWLVVRRRKLAPGAEWTAERAWRVDAAYVWPAPGPSAPPPPDGILSDVQEMPERHGSVWPWRLGRDPDGTPRIDPEVGSPPYRVVGRSWPCHLTDGGWSTDAGLADGGGKLDAPLTAAGWGDPTFAAFYPGCQGQFGHYDDGTDDQGMPVSLGSPEGTPSIEYLVLGWFSGVADDPLSRLRADFPGLDPADLKALVNRRLGWSVSGELPASVLLVGRVSHPNFLNTDRPGAAGTFDVAVGGTGTQALAALLADEVAEGDALKGRLPERDTLERQLDAVLFSKQLAGQTVDVGRGLDDLVLRRGFAVRHGGLRWVIGGRPPEAAALGANAYAPAPRPTEKIELPESVASVVEQLNVAQSRYDTADRQVGALRELVYADWYRAVVATDPTASFALDWVLQDQAEGGTVTADTIFAYLRQVRLPALLAALGEREAAEAAGDQAGAEVQRALAAHNAIPRAPQWSLDPTPGPGFYAPSEVAVAVVPSSRTSTRMRWRGAGLAHDKHGALLTATCDLVPDGAADLKPLLDSVVTLGLDPAVSANETPPLRMDWRAQLAARSGSGGGAGYRADWLSNPGDQYDEPIELSGTALLTDEAGPQLQAALLRYLRSRLSAPSRTMLGAEEVDALTALVDPPAGCKVTSWFTPLDPPDDAKDDAALGALLDSEGARLEKWAADWVSARQLVAGAADLAAWETAPKRPGFPGTGPLMVRVRDWLFGAADGQARALGLPARVASVIGGAGDWPALLGLFVGPAPALSAAWRPPVLASLLRAAEATSGPFAHGVPVGGALAAAVTELANSAPEERLHELVGFSDAAVASLLEHRPFHDFSELAGAAAVDTAVVAGLVAGVEADLSGGQLSQPVASPTAASAVVDPLATVLAAWNQLKAHGPALVHTLDGFNDALLQWDAAPQLPVADPVGFDDHKAFAADVVRPAVGAARRRAPRPDLPFVPLRAGALALTGLRLVDTFGVVQDVTWTGLSRPASWSGKHGNFPVELPARVLQAARLRVDWLDGEDPRRTWTPHPGRSPLCGWLVADTFEGRLDFHSPDGDLLGSLDGEGVWRVAPGRGGPAVLRGILQPGLRALASSLAAGARSPDADDPDGAVVRLMDEIDAALDNVHPETNQDDEALSLLLSRPLAVVEAAISVELERPLATRLDPAGLVAALAGAAPDRRQVDQVRVPVTIGERHRLADGVVAWCEVLQDGTLGPLRAPHEATAVLDIVMDPDAAPRTLLLLVDPTAAIHLQTPVLPPLVLRLPAEAVNKAARARELRAYTGPHLTPRGDLRAPMVKESGWVTTMLLAEPGRWLELGQAPLVERAALEAKLDSPSGVWNALLRDAILTPVPGRPTLARLAALPASAPGKPPVPLEDRLSGYAAPAQLVTALHTVGRSFLPPLPALGPEPLELREAYLSLRRDDG